MTKREMHGKVVLVTGGSSGIGLATAMRFAREGAAIALLARDQARLRAAARMVARVAEAEPLPIACDVTCENEVISAFDETLSRLGRLDVAVSNAGSVITAPLMETTLDQWNVMMGVHATAYFLVARQAVRAFVQQKIPGVIVFNISDNAVKPSKDFLAYNVAKAAELHMARCIAEEVGVHGIRINSVLPGAVFGSSAVWTPEFRRARATAHGFDPDRLEIDYRKHAALGVTILPEEVAEAIYFLASDHANKITGAVISIDGGGKSGYVR